MYLTAVDFGWEENVPTQMLTGKRMGQETLAWSFFFFVPLREARVLLLCPGSCKARVWGQIWLTSGDTDKPSPGPKPLPRVKPTENPMTGTGTRTLVLTRSWGSLRTGCAMWLPTNAARAFCPLKTQEPGQSSTTLTCFWVTREATQRCPQEEKRHWWKKRPMTASSSWDSPYPLPAPLSPGAAQGPHVLRPLKPLVLSPRSPGCVCVSG